MFLEKPHDFCIIKERGASSLITNSSIHLFQPERLAGYPFFPLPISGLYFSLIRLDIMSWIRAQVESKADVKSIDIIVRIWEQQKKVPNMSFLPGKRHHISFHSASLFCSNNKRRKIIKLRVCYSVFSFDENTKLLGTELYLLIQKAPGSSSKQ